MKYADDTVLIVDRVRKTKRTHTNSSEEKQELKIKPQLQDDRMHVR